MFSFFSVICAATLAGQVHIESMRPRALVGRSAARISALPPKDEVDHTIVLPVHDLITDAAVSGGGNSKVSGVFYIGYKPDPGWVRWWKDENGAEQRPTLYVGERRTAAETLAPDDYNWLPIDAGNLTLNPDTGTPPDSTRSRVNFTATYTPGIHNYTVIAVTLDGVAADNRDLPETCLAIALIGNRKATDPAIAQLPIKATINIAMQNSEAQRKVLLSKSRNARTERSIFGMVRNPSNSVIPIDFIRPMELSNRVAKHIYLYKHEMFFAHQYWIVAGQPAALAWGCHVKVLDDPYHLGGKATWTDITLNNLFSSYDRYGSVANEKANKFDVLRVYAKDKSTPDPTLVSEHDECDGVIRDVD